MFCMFTTELEPKILLWPTGNGNSLLPRREFQMVIPDAFRKTGYRGNFDEVYNRLMGVKE
jgi:hypothetical protein